MLDLSHPDIDFASLARGMGLTAWRSKTADEFSEHLAAAMATPGRTVATGAPDPGESQSAASTDSAELTSRPGFCSTNSAVTTPSSRIAA